MAVLRNPDPVYKCVPVVKRTLEKKIWFVARSVAWFTHVLAGTSIGDGSLVKRLVRTALT